jgi:hypothetical protein
MGALGRLVAATLLVGLVALPRVASAQAAPRLTVQWDRLFEGGAAWLRGRVEGDRAALYPETQLTPEASRTAPPSQLGTAWFGADPHVSIVARDWGDARRLAGRLSVTDQLRLSRSSRMVVTRVRLGEGLIVPFAQLGVGQWRVDTEVMPAWSRDIEAAVQIGGGFELRLGHAYALAVESDYTVLYREQHEAQNVLTPRFWGVLAAARIGF